MKVNSAEANQLLLIRGSLYANLSYLARAGWVIFFGTNKTDDKGKLSTIDTKSQEQL